MQPRPEKKPASVEDLVNGFDRLPSLPAVVAELIETLNGGNTNFACLADEIAKDQSLVARVMRLANSPFYGFPGGIGSIREAVTLLGFNSVRNLVVTSTLMDLFPGQGGEFDWPEFWRHSLHTGACARLLAAAVRQDREAAFLAGILHDVGRLLVGAYLPGEFAASLAFQEEHGVPLIEADQALWGTDHTRLGSAAARHWRLPEPICHAVENHHAPVPAVDMPLTDITYLANVLEQELHASPGGTDLSECLAEDAHRRLGLDRQILSRIAGQAAEASSAAEPQ
jgi:putative nucleotidyltransferase with HDIG domain